MSGGQTVLVADDDQAVRELHAVWLEEAGYEVLEAPEGETTLEEATDADAVLLDREMPGPSGGDVAREIHDREDDCFVIVVSGVEPDFDIVDVPIDSYLVKPVSREEILDATRRVLSQAIPRRLLREFFSLRARKRTLERCKHANELADSDEYRRLQREIAAKRVEIEDVLDAVGEERRERIEAVLADRGSTAGSSS